MAKKTGDGELEDKYKERNYGVSKRMFLYFWETSETLADAVATMAKTSKAAGRPPMPTSVVLDRAEIYKSQGLTLKDLPSGVPELDQKYWEDFLKKVRAGEKVVLEEPVKRLPPPFIPDPTDAIKGILERMRKLQDPQANPGGN